MARPPPPHAPGRTEAPLAGPGCMPVGTWPLAATPCLVRNPPRVRPFLLLNSLSSAWLLETPRGRGACLWGRLGPDICGGCAEGGQAHRRRCAVHTPCACGPQSPPPCALRSRCSTSEECPCRSTPSLALILPTACSASSGHLWRGAQHHDCNLGIRSALVSPGVH